MTREDHLLTIAAEECNEIAQRISKALRFGLTEVQPGQADTNAHRIEEEMRDLMEMMRMLQEEGALSHRWTRPKPAKRAKVENFLNLSRIKGRLDP